MPGRGPMLAAGTAFGLALWHVAGNIGGDGFFHLARVQKLLAFDDLSLASANEFADGGLHPGYAFPLWHGLLALVAKVSGADPVDVVLHGPSVLAPIAVVVAYEAGWALLPPGRAGRRLRGRAGVGARRDGARGGRRADRARAARDELAAAPRPGCARAGGRGDAARRRSRSSRRPRPPRSRSPSSTRRTPSSSGSRSPGFLVVRWLWAHRDGRAGALALAALVAPRGGVLRLAPPRDRRHRLGEPGRRRARARLREVRGPARRHGRPLLGDARALRPDGRDRGRRAAPDPARRARGAARWAA